MIYLASPYTSADSDLMDRRYELICNACAGYTKSGLHVYSPIAHWHPIAKQYDLPRDADYWQEHNFLMIEYCPDFWAIKFPGWQSSIGLAAEVMKAKHIGRKVTYIEP